MKRYPLWGATTAAVAASLATTALATTALATTALATTALVAVSAATVMLPRSVAAKSTFSSRGEVGLETRAFFPDDEALTREFGAAVVGRVEWKHKHRYQALPIKFREQVRVLGRHDGFDRGRSELIIEEAWAEAKWDRFRMRAGAQMLTWTATEAFQPADTINSRYLDSNIENPDKIGEPMLSLSAKLYQGTVAIYYMPAYLKPIMPSARSRQNFAPPGERLASPLWLERDGDFSGDNFGHQWALRVAQTFGRADLSLHVGQTMDRYQPEVVLDLTSQRFRPLYQAVTQVGGTYQHALGAFVIKVEARGRFFYRPSSEQTKFGALHNKNHAMVAVGAEYGLTHDTGWDSTFILEGQSVFGAPKDTRLDLSLFQRDLMVGYRLAFNDTASRELFTLLIFDVERKEELLYGLTYQQRVGEQWSVRGGFRIIHAPRKDQRARGLEQLHQAHQASLTITRHF